jgi:predicted CopG family antitoxin
MFSERKRLVTKDISISEEAYFRLAASMKLHESFTDVINRLTGRKSILDLSGTLSISESRELSNHVSDLRKKSLKRSRALVKKFRKRGNS